MQNNNGPVQSTHHFDELDVDLRRLLMLLWRRKWIVVLIMLVALVSAFFITTVLPTRYTANALVLIESERIDHSSIDLQNFMSSMRLDTTLVLSEVEVLKSQELGRRVVQKLSMRPNPLNGEAGSFKSLSVHNSEMKDRNNVLDQDTARVVAAFLQRLNVKPVPGSFVIQVSYTAEDPEKAALVANTVVDTYLEERLNAKFRATQKVTSWLDGRLNVLRKQLRDAEGAVEAYRSQNGLITGARYEITAQQMSELNSQLVLAKSEKAAAVAKLKDIEKWANNPSGFESDEAVANSRNVQELKKTETDILRRKADLSSRYGSKHPSIININAELVDLRKKMRSEVSNVAGNLKSDLSIAEKKIEALEMSLNEVSGLKKGENHSMIRLRELEREAESNRMIFDTFLASYKRSDSQEELDGPEARIISYAAAPEAPSYPNKPLIMSLTSAIALFVGITLVLILEKLDNAFRSASQLETRTGYSCYGLIPMAENAGKGGLGDYILNKPSSAVSESIRTLRMVLNLRSSQSDQDKPKVVTITSSLPAEGKTTLSTWLARLAAKSGEKVIVIDCDLRRPNLHRLFRQSNDKTIVDYLSGDASLESVVTKDEASGAHVIYARSVPNSALDLISSKKMSQLIASLKKAYDLVILDTPACLAVSDARLLANESDYTLYIVEWDKTPREVVTTGVKQFSDFGYENLSLVLSNVDVKRHARYGYGDTAYYYGRFKEYYT